MKKLFIILFFCVSMAACAKIDSVHPFDAEQATILIHHMYPQTLKPANECTKLYSRQWH